jgi:hypothetical protein
MTKEGPEHLQHARNDPAFRAVGSARLLEAIDAVLQGQAYGTRKNWGSPFVAFPSKHEWTVPSGLWDLDANYLRALSPLGGIRIYTLFGDVATRAGDTLSTSWTIRHPRMHGVPTIANGFAGIRIFVTCTRKAMQAHARRRSWTALKNMTVSCCKWSRRRGQR